MVIYQGLTHGVNGLIRILIRRRELMFRKHHTLLAINHDEEQLFLDNC